MTLTDLSIKHLKHSGKPAGDKHTDGRGMFLLVKAAGKYWRMDYTFMDSRKTLALGVYPDVSLSLARQKRDAARELVAQNIDPGFAKREAKIAKIHESKNTVKAVGLAWLENSKNNRNAKRQHDLQALLVRDVFPAIGILPIASVGPRDILPILRKIEKRGAPCSALNVKSMMGQVFRYAVIEGFAERDVTADLKGAMASFERGNHPAITEEKEVGAMMRLIFEYHGQPTTRAFLILSSMVFTRSIELRTMEWAELDLDAAEWRIPASKMKMKKAHIVPLSTQAIEMLRFLQTLTGQRRFVFWSVVSKTGHMAACTPNAALRALGIVKEVHTQHGFRAMARTVMAEGMEERVDLIEHQLAHTQKDPNGLAYDRTKYLKKRHEMMQRWADHLDTLRIGAQIIPMRAA